MVNKEAVEMAKRAVEHDTKGQWQDAVTCYEQAAAFILKENPSDADKYVSSVWGPSQLCLCLCLYLIYRECLLG
jgi:hypothetical protein